MCIFLKGGIFSILSPVHTKNGNYKDNYKDNDISIHTSERYCLLFEAHASLPL